MGGSGSGRSWSISAKATTERARPLDIRTLKRKGLLTPGCSFEWYWAAGSTATTAIRIRVEVDHVVLIYLQCRHCEAEWETVEQTVDIFHTPCTYGGTRCWWHCPGCGRRVAILYARGKFYACRHCHNLVYSTQCENDTFRAARRADRIRRKLGWVLGILNSTCRSKPKGMRWRTFERLTREHDVLLREALTSLVKWRGKLQK